MGARNDGGPAFPVYELNGNGKLDCTCPGMTLRDYFAAKAMQGEISSMRDRGLPLDISDESLARLTSHYYRIADAMLKARAE